MGYACGPESERMTAMRLLIAGALLAMAVSVVRAEPITVLDGRVRLELPENFVELTPAMLARRYKRGTPQAAFTDPGGRMDVALTVRPLDPGEVPVTPAALAEMRAGIEESVSIATWRSAEIRRIGGLEAVYFEFVSDPADEEGSQALNHLIITARDGELIAINIGCQIVLEAVCTEMSTQVIRSLRMR